MGPCPWTVQGSLPLIRGREHANSIKGGRINKAHSAIQRIDSPTPADRSPAFRFTTALTQPFNRLSTHDPSCFRSPILLSFLSVAALFSLKERKNPRKVAIGQLPPKELSSAVASCPRSQLFQEAAGAAGFRRGLSYTFLAAGFTTDAAAADALLPGEACHDPPAPAGAAGPPRPLARRLPAQKVALLAAVASGPCMTSKPLLFSFCMTT